MRSGSAVEAQWKRSGSAVEAQWMRGLKPLYCIDVMYRLVWATSKTIFYKNTFNIVVKLNVILQY